MHVILSSSKDDVRDKYDGSWFDELTMTWLTMTHLSLYIRKGRSRFAATKDICEPTMKRLKSGGPREKSPQPAHLTAVPAGQYE